MNKKLQEDLKKYNAMREHAFVKYLSAYKNNEKSEVINELEDIVNEFDSMISSMELVIKKI